MDPITAVVAGLSLMIVTVVSIVLFMNNSNSQKQLDDKMKNVVNQINDTQYVAFKFDQTQQANLRTINSNIQNLDTTIKTTQRTIETNKQSVDTELTSIKNDYIRRDALPKGVPAIKTNRLQLGENHVFSACNNNMLVMYNNSNEIRGGLTVQDAIVMRNAAVSNIVTNDASVYNQLAVKGITSAPFTTFRAGSSNDITGNTSIMGNVNVGGVIVGGSNITLQGRLQFTNPQDASLRMPTSYSLDRVQSTRNTAMRFNLIGSTEDAVEIGTPKSTGHTFTVDGRASHAKSLSVPDLSTSNLNLASKNAYMREDGSGYFKTNVGIGTEPTMAKLFVQGGEPGEYSTIINNNQSQVLLGKDNGDALQIKTKSAKGNVSALSVYSAAGELLNVLNNGDMNMGINNRDIQLHGNVRVAKGIDTIATDAPLNIGATSSRVIIGNNNNGGFAYAQNSTPKTNATVVTNPMFVSNTLRVNRSQTDPLPSGWTGGINTNQVYANGTIGVGLTGEQAAYINSDGSIHGRLAGTSSDARLKDDIKAIGKKESAQLSKLRPVSYTFKSDPKKKTRFGFISQEVEKVYPDLVYESQNGTQGLDYNGIIPLVVDRVQNLDSIVQTDKKQICLGDTCITEEDLKKLKR